MTNTLPFTIFLLCLLCLNYLFFFFIPQAASTPLNPLSFQCEFVKLRIDLLQAFSQLICTCNSLKTSPPPAIATTIAMTLGNDLQRCGRISNQACLNFIFSAVFIYTLEVFEVSCEIKKFWNLEIRGLTYQQQQMLLNSSAFQNTSYESLLKWQNDWWYLTPCYIFI